MSVTVERCNTSGDLLHCLVPNGLAELQAVIEHADRTLPRFVTREVDGYLRFGDPQEGFAWLVRSEEHTSDGRSGVCPSDRASQAKPSRGSPKRR